MRNDMLFSKPQRRIKRVLIVEDEPLVAFDNEHFLSDAGYEVIATVDNVADAAVLIGRERIDLVMTDVQLSGGGSGTDVAQAARARGMPVLFVTGSCPPEAQQLSVGCLAKPYSQRELVLAIEAVDAKLGGGRVRRAPPSLRLFG